MRSNSLTEADISFVLNFLNFFNFLNFPNLRNKIMNNVFVYCEIEGTQVQEVSQELLTKGRKLANELGVDLNAIVAGTGIK